MEDFEILEIEYNHKGKKYVLYPNKPWKKQELLKDMISYEEYIGVKTIDSLESGTNEEFIADFIKCLDNIFSDEPEVKEEIEFFLDDNPENDISQVRLG